MIANNVALILVLGGTGHGNELLNILVDKKSFRLVFLIFYRLLLKSLSGSWRWGYL